MYARLTIGAVTALDSPITPAAFAERVLAFCTRTGASVTSWIRTVAHNAVVGGVARSPHIGGFGCDVVYDAPRTPAQLDALAAELGLCVIHEGDHDHLQPRDWRI